MERAVHQDQTGDAGGGGGGEQAGQPGGELPVPGGDRQVEQKSPQQDDGPEAHHDQAGRVRILIGQQAQHAASPFCRGRSPRLPCPDAEQHTGSSPCQYAVRPGPSVDSYKVEYSIPSQDIQVNDFSPPPRIFIPYI